METVVICNKTKTGNLLEATFAPSKGMNMLSYKNNSLEVIDQNTKTDFTNCSDGLGALVGPHYQLLHPEVAPKIKNSKHFPHISVLKEKGISEPFFSGISRYAAWNFETSENAIKAVLHGKDTLNGDPLESLEGQGFKMTFDAIMKEDGLDITMSVVSDSDSLVGLDYNYALCDGKGSILSDVIDTYEFKNEEKKIPSDWAYEHQHLTYDLSSSADFLFYPYLNPLSGNILLKTGSYAVRTIYNCTNEENCWHLYHPSNASFVRMTPMSTRRPKKPQLSVSFLKAKIIIEGI